MKIFFNRMCHLVKCDPAGVTDNETRYLAASQQENSYCLLASQFGVVAKIISIKMPRNGNCLALFRGISLENKPALMQAIKKSIAIALPLPVKQKPGNLLQKIMKYLKKR